MATQMITQICGGEVSTIEADKSSIQKNKIINFDTNLTKTLGGISINTKDQTTILNNLGFLVKSKKNTVIEITVPTFRLDIDGPADIVEEILRIYGFDKIIPISLAKDINNKKETLSANLKSFYKSKRLVANRGYLETVSWSFIDSKEANYINNNVSIDIKNPISTDLSSMRPSAFPNLLSSINPNVARLYTNGKLFEVGPNFNGLEEIDQQMVATGIQYGSTSSSSWLNEARVTDVFDILKPKKRSEIKPSGFVLGKNNIYLTTDNGLLIVVDIYTGRSSLVLKIDNNKISRPFFLNKNLFIIKENAIIKLN